MMVETDTGTPKENSQEDMQTLYETSMKGLQEGNVLRGKVINIAGDSVIVDVGLKSEGIVSLQEFPPKEGDAKPVSVDDEVEVMIVGREKESGLLRLSKKRVDEIKTWERIDKSSKTASPWKATSCPRSRADLSSIWVSTPSFPCHRSTSNR